MKNPITTKDLMAINELVLFEQWASTKFRHFYDAVEDKKLKEIMKEACLSHADRHDALFEYLKLNAKANMKGEEK